MKMLGQVWRLCEVVRQPSSFLALSKQFVEKSTSKQFTENGLKRLVYFGAKLVNSFHAEFFHNMLFFFLVNFWRPVVFKLQLSSLYSAPRQEAAGGEDYSFQ